jgi:tetratricopeptide (TPR) repeat protein
VICPEAIAFYGRAVQQRPDYPDVHARLGLVFFNLQRYQESIDPFNRAFRMKPSLRGEPWYSVPFEYSVQVADSEDAVTASDPPSTGMTV